MRGAGSPLSWVDGGWGWFARSSKVDQDTAMLNVCIFLYTFSLRNEML